MADNRGFNGGQFAVELGSEAAGWVYSVEGGLPSADVVLEKVGNDLIAHKHLGPIKFDEISLKCGTGMSRAFYDWIQRSLGKNSTRQNGAIITANSDYAEVSRLNFYEALISEVALPALDASSKESAALSVKFLPEHTRRVSGGGHRITGKYPTQAKLQKQWLPSNFRVDIMGLKDACTRVSKVEAVSVKQKLVEVPQAGKRTNYREPASIEFSNLVLTVAESHADPFYDWFQDFVVDGKCAQEMEKTGSLEFMSSDLKTSLFTVNFDHLGIFKITPDKVDAGSAAIRRVKVEMYCEDLNFDFSELRKATWA